MKITKSFIVSFLVTLAQFSYAIDFKANVEKVCGGFKFVEGPLYVQKNGELLFSDTDANRIYRVKDGELTVFRDRAWGPNGLTLDKHGRLIACEKWSRSVTRTEKNGAITVLADNFEGKKFNSPNDVIVRSDGSIFFTDPQFTKKGAVLELDFAGVYKISPDGKVSLLTKEFTRPNGIALSIDEKILYVNDTRENLIRAYDLSEDGSISNGRILTNEAIGADGMKLDTNGNIFCTTREGVKVFDKKGKHLGTIVFPEMPANCSFGDSDMSTLYATCRKGLYKVRPLAKGIDPVVGGDVKVSENPSN